MIHCSECGNLTLECFGELNVGLVTLQDAKYLQCIECGDQLFPEETWKRLDEAEILLDVAYGVEHSSKILMKESNDDDCSNSK